MPVPKEGPPMSRLGTVIVTGGAGFIGSALSQRLAATADRWVVIDSLHPQVHAERVRPASLADAAELVIADAASAPAWDELLADVRPDTIIHLAAETGTAQSLDEATRHAVANVVATTSMLDALGRAGVVPERFVLSSSRAVYGEGDWRTADGTFVRPGMRSHDQLVAARWAFDGLEPVPSSVARTVPSPTSVYGATKLAQEHLLEVWSGSRGARLDILRLQNVYGPGQSLINPYTGIVSLFSQLAARGEAIRVFEDGGITRDFVYIDDTVEAFAAALATASQARVRRFDVGFGAGRTILDLAIEIARFHDAPAPVITGEFRDGDVRFAACDITPTVEELDWTPSWDLTAGVAGLQDWIAAEHAGTSS
ncbi:NAD-dependent epimerase/dehydratase family protein [Agromyces sp. NPDC058136]|uniref:NAD-dependent epimerase/dehydratase family protein n=1 Tax=Agromyces sp. NPDC058136 TaxID=3346354 RepID=UPI0036DE9B39